MKKIQLLFRILLSPVIFLLSLGIMIIFPGTICLIFGLVLSIGKILGVNIDDDWDTLITMTTLIIWFPFVNSFTWIKEAKFLE